MMRHTITRYGEVIIDIDGVTYSHLGLDMFLYDISFPYLWSKTISKWFLTGKPFPKIQWTFPPVWRCQVSSLYRGPAQLLGEPTFSEDGTAQAMEPWRLLWYVLNIIQYIYIYIMYMRYNGISRYIYIYRQLQTCMWIYFFIYAYIYIIMIKWDEWNDMYELGCTLLWHSHFGFPRMVWRRCCSFIDTVGYVSSGQLDRGFQQASIDLQFGVIQATQLYDRYSIGWRCQVLLFYMNILYVLAGFIHMNAYIYIHTHIYR